MSMPNDNGFNLDLWNERWKNIQNDISKIETSITNLIKMMFGIIIAILGWALIQVYGQVTAKAAVPTNTTVISSK